MEYIANEISQLNKFMVFSESNRLLIQQIIVYLNLIFISKYHVKTSLLSQYYS